MTEIAQECDTLSEVQGMWWRRGGIRERSVLTG